MTAVPTLLLALLLRTTASPAACPAFAARGRQGAGGGNRTCYDFPRVRQMAGGPFQVDNTHGPDGVAQYIVAAPCRVVDPAAVLHPPRPCPNSTCDCSGFADGQRTDSPAFIFAGAMCFALGNVSEGATASLVDQANASAGVLLYYRGGPAGNGCAEGRISSSNWCAIRRRILWPGRPGR